MLGKHITGEMVPSNLIQARRLKIRQTTLVVLRPGNPLNFEGYDFLEGLGLRSAVAVENAPGRISDGSRRSAYSGISRLREHSEALPKPLVQAFDLGIMLLNQVGQGERHRCHHLQSV